MRRLKRRERASERYVVDKDRKDKETERREREKERQMYRER